MKGEHPARRWRQRENLISTGGFSIVTARAKLARVWERVAHGVDPAAQESRSSKLEFRSSWTRIVCSLLVSAMSTLASLLEQSRRLTKTQHSQLPPLQSTSSLPSAQGGANDLPVLQLGFDQLVSQSRRILARAGGSGAGTGREDGAGNAYYLLASGGVNADLLANTINNVNLTATFEPLLPLSDGDVEVRPLTAPLQC